ncbi:hypothetical protein TNCV_2277781 [Trichonephila clavipes]|nr:hypothetical protein TNCV_2277781 [Trichonephila clavipes]
MQQSCSCHQWQNGEYCPHPPTKVKYWAPSRKCQSGFGPPRILCPPHCGSVRYATACHTLFNMVLSTLFTAHVTLSCSSATSRGKGKRKLASLVKDRVCG